jgi:hypothetical protein
MHVMTRYAPFLTLLLPFGLLVWRPEWTSVAALGLWTALAAVYLCALLVGDRWAAEREAAGDERTLGGVLSLTEKLAALEMRTAKAERNIELCMPATPRARKDPPL